VADGTSPPTPRVRFLAVFNDVVDRLTDVLNFGRFLSIGLPGLIAAFAMLMFFSLVGTPYQRRPDTADSRLQVAVDSLLEELAEPDSAGGATVVQVDPEPGPGEQVLLTREQRLRFDFDCRTTTGRWFALFAVAVMLGSLISQWGFWIISRHRHERPGKPEPGLPYSWNTAHLPLLKQRININNDAGLTYQDILTKEYWRFVEFAANFPIALIVAAFFMGAYFLYLGRTYAHPLPWLGWGFPVLALVMLVLDVLWWNPHVVKSAYRHYALARSGMIAGLILFSDAAETKTGALGAELLAEAGVKAAYEEEFLRQMRPKPER